MKGESADQDQPRKMEALLASENTNETVTANP